jgi:hypothetical protein
MVKWWSQMGCVGLFKKRAWLECTADTLPVLSDKIFWNPKLLFYHWLFRIGRNFTWMRPICCLRTCTRGGDAVINISWRYFFRSIIFFCFSRKTSGGSSTTLVVK